MSGTPKLDYYSEDGRWHWRLTASNGRIVAQSAFGDGFATKHSARRGFQAARKVLGMDRYECTNGEADCYVMTTWGAA